MKHITLVVCTPTSMLGDVIPGSKQRQCKACGCGVWVSPSSIKDIPSLQGEIELRCVKCSLATVKKAKRDGNPVDYVPITAAQQSDLATFRDRFSQG